MKIEENKSFLEYAPVVVGKRIVEAVHPSVDANSFANGMACAIEHLLSKEQIGRWRKKEQDALSVIRICESPIEALLLCQLINSAMMLKLDVHFRGDRLNIGQADIVPQFDVGRFRLDFAVMTELGEKFAIECDGHEFHERTKEQAAKDRSRERELVSEGWKVLRFTGSEVWKDGRACSRQVLNIVMGA